ncbi:hypothetical protein RhiirA5_424581 [Rhizophagus irregularis]|uniref:Uncharacterized protein n=1 Tax=Rhizophagus irregularis TaxID=588596 RepID=A0A2N0P7T2_9GLOM|nr:hypothetical protein RhiirA5_424581 [Rhizophagus irregularis]
MPPTYQKLNDSHIANFRSFKNFDKIIDEKTVQCKCGNTVRLDQEETELREPLPCVGLFGDLYTSYATSTLTFFGGAERPEVVEKRLFPEKFPQDTPFCRKKLNKDWIQEFNTALQATATWKVD